MSFWCHIGVILVSMKAVVEILFELIIDEFSINFLVDSYQFFDILVPFLVSF